MGKIPQGGGDGAGNARRSGVDEVGCRGVDLQSGKRCCDSRRNKQACVVRLVGKRRGAVDAAGKCDAEESKRFHSGWKTYPAIRHSIENERHGAVWLGWD